MGASIGKVRAPIGEGRVRAAARRASSSIPASRVAGRGVRGRTRAVACATTSPLGNVRKRREGIACVGEGGGARGRVRDWSREGGAFLGRPASRCRERGDVRVARKVAPGVPRGPEGGYRASPLRRAFGRARTCRLRARVVQVSAPRTASPIGYRLAFFFSKSGVHLRLFSTLNGELPKSQTFFSH